jgi:hypothetical protein
MSLDMGLQVTSLKIWLLAAFEGAKFVSFKYTNLYGITLKSKQGLPLLSLIISRSLPSHHCQESVRQKDLQRRLQDL